MAFAGAACADSTPSKQAVGNTEHALSFFEPDIGMGDDLRKEVEAKLRLMELNPEHNTEGRWHEVEGGSAYWRLLAGRVIGGLH